MASQKLQAAQYQQENRDSTTSIAGGHLSNPRNTSRPARSQIGEGCRCPQCPVIEGQQGSGGLFDPSFAAPLLPSACNGAARAGQPMTGVWAIGKRRRAVKFSQSGTIGPLLGSNGLLLKLDFRQPGTCRGRNDSERAAPLADGKPFLLCLDRAGLDGRCGDCMQQIAV